MPLSIGAPDAGRPSIFQRPFARAESNYSVPVVPVIGDKLETLETNSGGGGRAAAAPVTRALTPDEIPPFRICMV